VFRGSLERLPADVAEGLLELSSSLALEEVKAA